MPSSLIVSTPGHILEPNMDRRAYPFSNKSFRPHRLFRRNDFTSKSHPTSYAKTSLQHMYKYAWTYHIRHYSDPSPFLLNSELARNFRWSRNRNWLGMGCSWVRARWWFLSSPQKSSVLLPVLKHIFISAQFTAWTVAHHYQLNYIVDQTMPIIL